MPDYLLELIVSLTSLVAVGVTLFKAQAKETEANAKAVGELVETSQDLRERVVQLEQENQSKDKELERLRGEAAQIPSLEAQVRYLGEDLARVQREATALEGRLSRDMQSKQAEIDGLKGKEG